MFAESICWRDSLGGPRVEAGNWSDFCTAVSTRRQRVLIISAERLKIKPFDCHLWAPDPRLGAPPHLVQAPFCACELRRARGKGAACAKVFFLPVPGVMREKAMAEELASAAERPEPVVAVVNPRAVDAGRGM